MTLKSKSTERPVIESISPAAALPGGDFQIKGRSFLLAPRPIVSIGGVAAPLTVGSDSLVVARVPEGAERGEVIVSNGEQESSSTEVLLGALVADSLHPVASPVVDKKGNIYTTFSGARGQKTPVAVFQIDRHGEVTPYLTDLMNATGLAFSPAGVLHISSRFDGIVYEAGEAGTMSVYVEGMGVATGIAFDKAGDLFVGDRSGTIFKISQQRQIYVFATLEPSISAYHLAIAPSGDLYVTGPTTSSYDAVYRITPEGEVSVFYRGLGRPQGMAFDALGNLFVAASYQGRKGIVRITPGGEVSLYVSGPNMVGAAIAPGGDLLLTTTNALYRLKAGLKYWSNN